MKKILFTCISFVALSLTTFTNLTAQDTSYQKSKEIEPPLFSGNSGFRKWSVGFNVGALAPFAASGGKNDFSKWLPTLGYGAYIKYQASHVFGIQADFVRGVLEGNNEKLQNGQPVVSPYKSFNTDMNWSVSLSGVLTFANINWSQLHTVVQPYVSIGGGAVNFTPRTVNNAGVTEVLAPKSNYTEFFVPVGLGIKANLSRSINLDLGYTMAFVDADNIDGYFKAPFIGDKYSYGHIGLEFALGRSTKPQIATHNAPAQMGNNIKQGDDLLRASLLASEERYNQRLNEMNGLKEDLQRMKMDSDGDGVSDYFDKCANTPRGEKVDGGGCTLPVVKVVSKDTTINVTNTYVITDEDKRIVFDAIRNLEFETGKFVIKTKSFPYLKRVADLLKQKGFRLTLGGHTDNVGSDATNMTLSNNRANSVRTYLIQQGADAAKIDATGYGETMPIESNKTTKGRQNNRRVEFNLY